MDTAKMHVLKNKLEQLETELSEHDRKSAIDEINALVVEVNKDLEEYLRQMKLIEVEQSLQKHSN